MSFAEEESVDRARLLWTILTSAIVAIFTYSFIVHASYVYSHERSFNWDPVVLLGSLAIEVATIAEVVRRKGRLPIWVLLLIVSTADCALYLSYSGIAVI
jgi:hypothetical protein